MTIEWYLHSFDKIFDHTGLSGSTFVGIPPQPVQAMRQWFLIQAVQQYDLLQIWVLWATLFEALITSLGL